MVNRGSGTVSVIDTERLAVTTVIRITTDQYVTTPDGTTPDGRFLYVTDASEALTVIDTATDTVIGKLPVGSGNKIFTPDGLGHAADWFGGGVTTFDVATNQVVASTSVGERPHGIVLGPDGNFYVADGADTVTAVDPRTSTVAGVIRVGADPTGLLQIPGRRVLYVTSETAGAVYVIDVDRKAVVTTIQIGGMPTATELSPDGRTAYVVNRAGSLTVIDTATDKVITSVSLTGAPFAAVLAPDGQTVYVISGRSDTTGSMLSVVRTSDNSVAKEIPLGASPFTTVSPDGRTIVGSSTNSNTVTVIDTADNEVVGTVIVGDSPGDPLISPDGTRAYVPVTGTSSLAVVDLGTAAR